MTSGRAPGTAQRVTAGDSEADSDGPGPNSARSPSRVCTWNVGGSLSPDARKRLVLAGASSSASRLTAEQAAPALALMSPPPPPTRAPSNGP